MGEKKKQEYRKTKALLLKPGVLAKLSLLQSPETAGTVHITIVKCFKYKKCKCKEECKCKKFNMKCVTDTHYL